MMGQVDEKVTRKLLWSAMRQPGSFWVSANILGKDNTGVTGKTAPTSPTIFKRPKSRRPYTGLALLISAAGLLLAALKISAY